MNKNPILVVAGEPNSIFSEILFKSLNFLKKKNPIILFISYELLIKQLKILNYKIEINYLNLKELNQSKLSFNKLNVVDISYKFKKPFEKASIKSNDYINKCFEEALKFTKKNKISGLINGPINKNYFLKSKYFGVTEYLAEKLEVKKDKFAMLIYNSKISVSPMTTHLPIKYISKNLNKRLIEKKVTLIDEFYRKYFSKKPKIAITGLNPHCENFLSKSEEKSIIMPAIRNLKNKKIHVYGPYPADTIFLKDQLKKFNTVIGMYHDQVLAPIKAIHGFEAINITLGLPFLRISPDHGPNEKMVGKNKSNYKSLLFAFNFLSKLK